MKDCVLGERCKCMAQAVAEGKVGITAHNTCVNWQPGPTTVPDRLRKLADLYEERNKIYGDDYKRHGDIMTAFFPEGVTLNTSEDFNRYGVFKELVTKLNRYAAQWTKGGHPDSLNDQAVYSMMLQELDACWRELYTVADTLDASDTFRACGAHWLANGRIACMECDVSWGFVKQASCIKNRKSDLNLGK